MIRTPFEVIQATVCCVSSMEIGSAMNSSTPGAISATDSATAVPWFSPLSHPKTSLVETPTAVKQRACTVEGSSVPRRATSPAKPPSMIPTLTPDPVIPAVCQLEAPWSVTPTDHVRRQGSSDGPDRPYTRDGRHREQVLRGDVRLDGFTADVHDASATAGQPGEHAGIGDAVEPDRDRDLGPETSLPSDELAQDGSILSARQPI